MQLLALLFAWSYLAHKADSFYRRIFSQRLKYGPDVAKGRSFLEISKRPQFRTDVGEFDSNSIKKVKVQLKKALDDGDSAEFVKIMKNVSRSNVIHNNCI